MFTKHLILLSQSFKIGTLIGRGRTNRLSQDHADASFPHFSYQNVKWSILVSGWITKALKVYRARLDTQPNEKVVSSVVHAVLAFSSARCGRCVRFAHSDTRYNFLHTFLDLKITGVVRKKKKVLS